MNRLCYFNKNDSRPTSIQNLISHFFNVKNTIHFIYELFHPIDVFDRGLCQKLDLMSGENSVFKVQQRKHTHRARACHRPLPVQLSQSEHVADGPQGPPVPSGTSDCCCSFQETPERWSDPEWHSSTFPRKQLDKRQRGTAVNLLHSFPFISLCIDTNCQQIVKN